MRWIAALGLCALLGFGVAGSASALTLTFDGATCATCHGIDVTVDISPNGGAGDYRVTYTMDFTDFDRDGASSPFDRTHVMSIGLKAFTGDFTAMLFSDPNGSFGDPFIGSISSSSCSTSPGDPFLCTNGDFEAPAADAMDQTATWVIDVAGAMIKTDGISVKFALGPGPGWVMSEESSTPVPEPTGAALLLVGGMVVGGGIRRRC